MYSKLRFLTRSAKHKTLSSYANLPKQAATVVPLCLNKAVPSILFMQRPVREKDPYSGQICFPGGKFDSKLDKTLVDTAVRECHEEIGISEIDVWGPTPGIPDYSGTMCVTGFVGDIGDVNPDNLIVNNDEVAKTFTVPIEVLLDETSHKVKNYERFRKGKQIQVPMPVWSLPGIRTKLWGLTACQLNLALHFLYGQEIYFHRLFPKG